VNRTKSDRAPEPYRVWDQLAVVVLFVAAGLVFKNWLLNGYVGPLFPLAVLYLAPLLIRRVRKARRER
jgi:hypothetical protein